MPLTIPWIVFPSFAAYCSCTTSPKTQERIDTHNRVRLYTTQNDASGDPSNVPSFYPRDSRANIYDAQSPEISLLRLKRRKKEKEKKYERWRVSHLFRLVLHRFLEFHCASVDNRWWIRRPRTSRISVQFHWIYRERIFFPQIVLIQAGIVCSPIGENLYRIEMWRSSDRLGPTAFATPDVR